MNETKLTYYPGGVGNKDITINLLDSAQRVIKTSQVNTKIFGPSDFILRAIDQSNTKRIAQGGDTLYLVGTNSRKVKFQVSSKNSADFDFDNPQWSVTYKGNPYGLNPYVSGKTEIEQALEINLFTFGHSIKSNASAYGISKNVYVKALTGNHKTLDLGGAINVPIARATSTITKHKNFANTIIKVLNKIPGSKFQQRSKSAILVKNRSEIEYDIILKCNKESYYEEDPNSNLCFKHEEFQIDYGLEVSGEFYLPFPYSFKFPLSKPIVAVGVFAGFEGGVTVRDKVESIKYLYSPTEQSNKGVETSIIGMVGLKFGGKAEVDLSFSESFKIEAEAMVYANPQLTLEKKIGGDFEFQALVNLIITASATVKTPIYDFEPAVITYTYTFLFTEID